MLYENVSIDITEDQITLTYIAYEDTPQNSKKCGIKYERKSDQSVEDFRKDSLKLLCEHLLLINNPINFYELVGKHL